MADGSPFDFFPFLVDNNILLKMVTETNNKFASQKIASFNNMPPHSKLGALNEIKPFLGAFQSMGLVQIPSYDHSWSTSTEFHTKVGQLMSRLALKFLCK